MIGSLPVRFSAGDGGNGVRRLCFDHRTADQGRQARGQGHYVRVSFAAQLQQHLADEAALGQGVVVVRRILVATRQHAAHVELGTRGRAHANDDRAVRVLGRVGIGHLDGQGAGQGYVGNVAARRRTAVTDLRRILAFHCRRRDHRVQDPHPGGRGLVDQHYRLAHHAVARERILLVHVAAEDAVARLDRELFFFVLARGIDFLGEHARVGQRLRGHQRHGLAVVDGDLEGDGVGLVSTVLVVIADLHDEPLAGLDAQRAPRPHVHAALGRPGKIVGDRRDVGVEVGRGERGREHLRPAGIAGNHLVDVGGGNHVAPGHFQDIVIGQGYEVRRRRDEQLVRLLAEDLHVAHRHRVAEILVHQQSHVAQGDRREAEIPGAIAALQLRFRRRGRCAAGLRQAEIEIGGVEGMERDPGRRQVGPRRHGPDHLPAVAGGGEHRQVVAAGRKPRVNVPRPIAQRQLFAAVDRQGGAGPSHLDPRGARAGLHQFAGKDHRIRRGSGGCVLRFRPGQLIGLGLFDRLALLRQLHDLPPFLQAGVITGVDAAFHSAGGPGDRRSARSPGIRPAGTSTHRRNFPGSRRAPATAWPGRARSRAPAPRAAGPSCQWKGPWVCGRRARSASSSWGRGR